MAKETHIKTDKKTRWRLGCLGVTVELTNDERAHLSGLIKKGKSSAQSNLKARILLKADQGEAGERWLDKNICTALNTNLSMIGRVRENWVNEGIEAVFMRKKREAPPIRPIFDGEAEARLIALACSEPPQGPCSLDAPPACRQGRGAGDRRKNTL